MKCGGGLCNTWAQGQLIGSLTSWANSANGTSSQPTSQSKKHQCGRESGSARSDASEPAFTGPGTPQWDAAIIKGYACKAQDRESNLSRRGEAARPHVTCLWFRPGQIIRSRSELIFSCTQTKSPSKKSYCNWCWNVINLPFSRTWVWKLELPTISTAQRQVHFVPPVFALLTKVWHANESRYK